MANKKKIRTIRLSGEYATTSEYARAVGVTDRAVRQRIARPNSGLVAVRIGRQMIIKI
jgi:hypothetical protein